MSDVNETDPTPTVDADGASTTDPVADGYRAMGALIRATPARILLDHLLNVRGCGWDMLHRVTGTRIRSLRLWRGGETPDPDAFNRLVEFAGFLDRLDTETGYTEPTRATSFMETRITRLPGYHLTPFALYLDGHRDLLITLAMAGDDLDREGALDRGLPDWRTKRSDYEVEIAADGQPALVRWDNRI